MVSVEYIRVNTLYYFRKGLHTPENLAMHLPVLKNVPVLYLIWSGLETVLLCRSGTSETTRLPNAVQQPRRHENEVCL
jgi:hypothetical protein